MKKRSERSPPASPIPLTKQQMKKRSAAKSSLASPIPLIKQQMKWKSAAKSPLGSPIPLMKRQMKKRSSVKSPLASPIPLMKRQMKKRSSVKSPLASPIPFLRQELKKRSAGKSARLHESPPHPHLRSHVDPRRTSKTHSKNPLLHQSPKSPIQKAPMTISEVKELASSRIDSMKRYLDRNHADILKEAEASGTRISKRITLQAQTCHQLIDETEKEYKKVHDRMEENLELAKASYAEFITEAQAAASRVRKVSIPEIARSVEKAIEDLRSRYRLSSA